MQKKFTSKIFLDGGVPAETKEAKELLGFLDGQTTNPTLIAKNLAARLVGEKLSQEVALEEYKRIAQAMSKVIPRGSVSIQVFADKNTSYKEMIRQARERRKWIKNSSIKLPCIPQGLRAAEIVCQEMPINITLAFSQAQAAAVYEATKKAKYPVFISPFVGRLDDRGENGMQVIANILRLYERGDGHVEVLTASVRTLDHALYALRLGSDIITIPLKIIKEWSQQNFVLPGADYTYPTGNLVPIPYREEIKLGQPWQAYDLHHDLTETGVTRFLSDWNGIVK